MYFYSATTGGLYDPDVCGTSMPGDVCEVSEAEYAALMMASSQGRIVKSGEDGRPVIAQAQAQAPTLEQLCSIERSWRNEKLLQACAIRDRHRDEQELFRSTTLIPERFVELLGYIQTLRDWPQSIAFPESALRPVAPTWLTEQIE